MEANRGDQAKGSKMAKIKRFEEGQLVWREFMSLTGWSLEICRVVRLPVNNPFWLTVENQQGHRFDIATHDLVAHDA